MKKLIIFVGIMFLLVGCSGGKGIDYEAIKIGDSITGEGGMSIDEVKDLIGSKPDNEAESQATFDGKTIKVVNITWLDGLGKGVTVSFINGQANAKVKVGQ
jgi:hypothetical protein